MHTFPIVILFLLHLTLITASEPPNQTENTKTDRSLKTSGNFLEPYTDVNPKFCRCILPNKECKLSIAKSSSLEINCPDNQHYCCDNNGKGTLAPVVTEKLETPAKTNQSSRIHIRILGYEDGGPARPQSPSDAKGLRKPDIRCSCRAREDCEDKHIDYTFGFHCSYDKVRCCETQDQIEKAILEKSGGRLITILTEPGSNDMSNYQCQCTSPGECQRLNFEVVRDGKDILCPFEFVKCCGTLIGKKSDTDFEPEGAESVDPQSQWSNSPADDETFNEQGEGINTHGQPGFRQPIQLPVIKIPINETAILERQRMNPVGNVPLSGASGQAEVVNSPPELPHSYQDARELVNVARIPMLYQQGVQRPPIYQYYGNVGENGPYRSENVVPVPYRFHVNTPPGPSERSGSANTGGSFLDKVSNFFFG